MFKGFFSGDLHARRFTINVLLAFIPAVVIGVLAVDFIKHVLFSPIVVACALIIGGLIIFAVEARKFEPKTIEATDISIKQAIIVGFAQCVAMIPGTSRSGSTIIGSLFMGVSRKAAAEFSFFLGIPVLMGAGLLDMYKMRHELHTQDMEILGVGIAVAFISALLVIRALIRYVSKHDFSAFAYYRIAFGLLILLTWGTGWVHW